MINENISKVNQNYESYRERLTNFGSEFELGLFLFIIQRNLKWVLIIAALAALSAFLYLRYNAPIYEASTVVQLSKSDNATKVLQVNEIYEDQNLSSEIELLKSKLLLEETVNRLPLQISYYLIGEILEKQLYKSSYINVDLISIHDSSIVNKKVSIIPLGNATFQLMLGENNISEPFQSNDVVDTPFFTASIYLESSNYSSDQELNEYYFVINSPSSLVHRFKGQMNVQVLNKIAQTILISYKDHNPMLAHDFVMAHANQYLEYDQDSRERSALNIINFIDNQIVQVYEVLRETEYDLNQFLKDNKTTDINRVSNNYIAFFQSFDERMIELEYEEHLLKEIEKITIQSSETLNVYELIPAITGTEFESSLRVLIEDLRMLLLNKEERKFNVTDSHGGIQNIDYRIKIQKDLITNAIASLREKLDSKREFLEDKLSQYEDSFFALPEKELEYARLQRHFKINEKYYTMLLEKQTEYRISKAGFVPESRILEDARIPTIPIAPNKNMVFTFAFVITLISSFLLFIIQYLTHNDLTSLHEIAKLSNASIGILGMTPKMESDVPVSQMVIDKNPKSMIAESFRNIRTNLQFMSGDQTSSKTIAITSTVSGEGKTFIAINLSGIIAFSGKKVILLDMDLRKPKIHVGFGTSNKAGISTLLVGKHELSDCIKQSNLDNLDYITSGPLPPNPSELLLSGNTDKLIRELKELYDVIIIDNPPVGMVTDGISIIQKVDFPIYVFRSDYSKKHFVQNVDRLINENGITKMTVVLNGVDVSRRRYGYNYSYGYGYGYGYGHNYGYYDNPEDSDKKRWYKFWK